MTKKRIIQMMLLGIIFTTALLVCSNIETTYTREATVIAVEEDIIIAEDFSGNEWEFFGDGFFEGEIIKLVMDNNNNDLNIANHKVKDVKKIR